MNAGRLGLTGLPLLDQSTYLLLVQRMRNIITIFGLFMRRSLQQLLLLLVGGGGAGFVSQRVGFLGQDVEAGAVGCGDVLGWRVLTQLTAALIIILLK